MRLTFLGANRQVTGSSYLLEAGGLRLMIDRGLFQERKHQWRNWNPPQLDEDRIDALLLTHAHLDHCGRLPRLVRDGFSGPVYTTEPSVELAQLVMEDSARIQLEDVKYKRKRHKKQGRKSKHPYEPLYTPEDAQAAGRLFQGVRYNEPVELNGSVTVRFVEAGHILGSAMLLVDVQEDGRTRRIVFSGDIGQWDVPIVGDPTLLDAADVVVMESTYGDKDHDRPKDIADQLADAISHTADRGGWVLIPTFAIERAQELLLYIAQLLDEGRIPRLPTFLDSPMAVNATEIFRRHRDFMDDETRELLAGHRLAEEWKHIHLIRSTDDSKAINGRKGPGIILAGSGMCTGGRIKHHLAHHIGDPNSAVLFVGYQAHGTLGRQISDGNDQVRIFGVPRTVRAQVRRVYGLSAHAGRDDLLRWLKGFGQPPGKLFLTHGDEDAAFSLADRVRDELRWSVDVPEYQSSVDF